MHFSSQASFIVVTRTCPGTPILRARYTPAQCRQSGSFMQSQRPGYGPNSHTFSLYAKKRLPGPTATHLSAIEEGEAVIDQL